MALGKDGRGVEMVEDGLERREEEREVRRRGEKEEMRWGGK